MHPLVAKVQGMMATSALVEANGKIDGKEGKDRGQGWFDLCEEMKFGNSIYLRQFRVSYENGWHEGWLEQNVKLTPCPEGEIK